MNQEIAHRRTYLWVFLALMILAAATAGISHVDLGVFNTIVALVIAFVKAGLVALFFMHVRESRRLIWLVIFGALVWLTILLGLTAADYLTRSWSTLPPKL